MSDDNFTFRGREEESDEMFGGLIGVEVKNEGSRVPVYIRRAGFQL
jgi:hypothetical protein